MNNLAEYYITRQNMFEAIMSATKKTLNDMVLGEVVRRMINDYQELEDMYNKNMEIEGKLRPIRCNKPS